jgi:transcriptional regulator with XRE-family HTH domain
MSKNQNQNQDRQPKGISIGGQYTYKINPEATRDLARGIGSNEPTRIMNECVEALRQHGYVPATTAPLLVDHHSSAHHKEWWDRHRAPGEYNNPEGGYAQMPDDWTSSRTEGRSSISGLRRTHRMAYVGNDVAIRMPSATSIKDFAAPSVPGKGSGETFDVPVDVQFRGGQIDGCVRVTRGGGGTWACEGLGFTPERSAYVAESVQCVLESRRPSRALRDTGDILERRRRWLVERGVSVSPILSTWTVTRAASNQPGTDDSTWIDFAKLVQHRRKERRWTQKVLASRVGRTMSWVSKVENAKEHVPLPMLRNLIATLEFSWYETFRTFNFPLDEELANLYLFKRISVAYARPIKLLRRPPGKGRVAELVGKTNEVLELYKRTATWDFGHQFEELIPELRAAFKHSKGEARESMNACLNRLAKLSMAIVEKYHHDEVTRYEETTQNIAAEIRERAGGVV